MLEALAGAEDRPPVTQEGMRSMPVSGTPAELMHEAGIDAESITATVRELAGARALAD